MIHQLIQQKFKEIYHTNPLIIRSPGRINLIGEHTDYNDGFVLPAAIDKSIYLGFAKNGSNTCRVYSMDYEEGQAFDLGSLTPRSGWINFIMGVTDQLVKKGYAVEGFDCVFGGDIPIGAGLSSSAALENGVGMGLSAVFELNIDKLELVNISQMAEHEFAGVKCGIMDMFASMMGKQGQAIRLDCRSLDYEYVPVNLGDYQLLLCDTQVAHSLADSAYNTRREECQTGVEIIKKNYPEVKNLRDVEPFMLEALKPEFPGKVYDRCHYVISENERLLKSCLALESGNLTDLGKWLYASHHGLSTQYEVSCEELDFLVEKTLDMPYVLGARMMGGGFGGCTLNLLEKSQKEHFVENMTWAYAEKFNQPLKTYEVRIENGTEKISL
ncbi:galactokinase [Negadavirga shengliensis]|uniref:Galactokinase n=1 Tax=Negadavirga shengliensis TaxID=1389218 RepID=A0ABV9SVH4_9BACT